MKDKRDASRKFKDLQMDAWMHARTHTHTSMDTCLPFNKKVTPNQIFYDPWIKQKVLEIFLEKTAPSFL